MRHVFRCVAALQAKCDRRKLVRGFLSDRSACLFRPQLFGIEEDRPENIKLLRISQVFERQLSRSISSLPTVTSLLAIVSISRCARIIACAAARSVGSGSEGIATRQVQSDSSQKIALVPPRESIRHVSPGRLWPPGFLGHPPIDSGQKIRELCDADRHNTIRHRGPQKAPALKPLREQARTLPIVPDDFYQVTATASEDIEIARMRVPLQCLLNQKSKGSESAAHIGVAGREPNSYVARDRNHRRSSTSRTRAKAAASTFASTRTRRPPPRLISIRPLRPDVAGRDCGGSSDGGFAMAATGFGPAIRTAAKRGTTAAGASIARACRRQVKRRLAETPFRRATSETFAPGTSVSSTSRIFSSDDHRRRRSTPSRTSTRICRP